MKILFFNLGSIEDRINAWGKEGFQNIFTQDVILWGPIPDEKFLYNGKEIPVINLYEETTLKDLFERLPENWIPDIVTCDTSALNYVPDIYLCPCKTILFTRDAWADTIYNRSLVELFDFIDYGIIDRSLYDHYQVNILPLSNCAVTLPDTKADAAGFENRDFDVISIINYNNSFYHERYKALYNLSDSVDNNLNIKYLTGLERNEINSYYRRSKIVLDWAHTLSNRSFEAAMNGCLLFSHESNYLIGQFWVPGQEYIPYNDDNLPELTKFYLENPDKAKKVIDNALRKISGLPATLGEAYWKQIKGAFSTEVDIKARILRCKSLPQGELHFRTATPFLYNYNYKASFPPDWATLYFKRIDLAIRNSHDEKSKISALIEASRMAFLLNKDSLAERYLTELEMILHGYGWLHYLRGRILSEKGKTDQALISAQKAVDCGLGNPELLKEYLLPVMEHNNCCDGRRITDYIWQSVHNDNNEFQVKCLLHLSFELKGDIHRKKQENDLSRNSYAEAIGYIPLPGCIYKLCPMLIEEKNFLELQNVTERGLSDSPYESIMVLYNACGLIGLDQVKKAKDILRDHKNAIKSFVTNRRLILTQKLTGLLLILLPLGKYLGLKIILLIIKILQKK